MVKVDTEVVTREGAAMGRTWDRRFIDLTGREYGALTVIRRTPGPRGTVQRHWLCQCRCGKQVVVAGRNLASGNTKSCGCKTHRPPRDLTGRVFWNWEVLAFDGSRNGHRFWRCRCECGTERAVAGNALRGHRSKSCGCRPRDEKPQPGWC